MMLRMWIRMVMALLALVYDFMTGVLGMDSNYATNSVPGLFLNSSPVDDWREEMVGGGDEVGMSGTMPGLCGIALRRSSPIRAFRPDLVARSDDEARSGGVVKVKMFNFVARDCFPAVLAQGVVVPANSLLEYLADEDINLDECECFWNGTEQNAARLKETLADVGEEIELKVRMGEG